MCRNIDLLISFDCNSTLSSFKIAFNFYLKLDSKLIILHRIINFSSKNNVASKQHIS